MILKKMKAYDRCFLLYALVVIMLSFTSRVTGQLTTIPKGSFIISMGESPQTINNGLKPYGLLYDVIRNYRVTVYWYINPGKLKDGVDLVHNGKSYRGGVFIIPEFLISPQVRSRITAWQAQGVVGAYSVANFSLFTSEITKIRSVPRWTMDKQNGIIAVQYLINAGIPPSAYGGSNTNNWKNPADLACCDDIFVMPHADPTWVTHSNLLYWNLNCKGFLWAACHAPSVLENLVNPANRDEQMNFLMKKDPAFVGTSGDQTDDNTLILYNNHNSGSPPYISRFPTDPVSQYIGRVEGATTNGSEKIYIPRQSAGTSARWNPSARILEYDASQRNVANPDTLGFTNVAAVLVYGRGFEDPNRGYVMYLGGHDHNGTTPEDIAAMRSMLNLSFLSSSDKSLAPDISFLPDTLISGKSVEFDYVLPDEANPAEYTTEWISSCGGTFLPNRFTKNVTYIPPAVNQSDTCYIGVTVTDLCERVSTEYKFLVLTANPSWTLQKTCANIPQTYTTAGEILNYDIALTNTGDVDISNVVITDDKAISGVQYQYGDDNSDNIMQPDEIWVYSAFSEVSQADIDAGFFTNIAMASGVSGGGILPDVSDTVTIIPTWIPSISLTKELVDGFSYNKVGDVISYSYTIENNGTVTLPGPFTVSDDRIPSIPPATGNLLPGAVVTVYASYTIQPSDLVAGNVTNVAVASTIFQGQPVVSNQSEVTVYVDQADLMVEKSVDNPRPNVGDVVTYTVTVLNEGPNPASGVSIVDIVPDGLEEIGNITEGGIYDPITRMITWTDISVFRPVELTYDAVVQAAYADVQFENYVEVATSDQFDPDSAPGNQSIDEDDDDTFLLSPRVADVFAHKLQIAEPFDISAPNGGQISYITQDSVISGTQIYYLITVGNLGPDTALNVLITDDFPPDVLNPQYSLDNGGTWTNWTGSFTIPVFPPTPEGIPALFRGFVPSFTPEGTFENSVAAESLITFDPDFENNDSTVVTRVTPVADISVNKTELVAPLVIGGAIDYEITIENHGPSLATAAVIEDDIDPAVITDVEYSIDGGVTWLSGWTGTYLYGTMNVGERFIFRVRGIVANAAPLPNVNPIPNTVVVSSATLDPNLTNNTETIETPLNNESDLSVIMGYNTPTCAGDTVFYSITVVNESNTINSFGAHVVGINNPFYFSNIQYSVDNGVTWLPWNLLTDQFDIPDPFLPLDTFRIIIKARLKRGLLPGPISGFIVVESDITPDPNSTNNTANWTVVVDNCADLSIVKTLITPPQLVIAGKPVEFLLTFTNNGPSDALQTAVADTLPPGIIGPLTAATCNTGGVFVPWTGLAQIGALSPGSSCFVRIRGIFDPSYSGDYENITCVNSGSPDPDDSNNKDTLVIQVFKPSLTLEKVPDKDMQVKAGETVTYAYTVTNNGNADLVNVSIMDIHGGTGQLGAIAPSTVPLLPIGASTVFTSTYVMTQQDIENGVSIDNIATATASYQGFTYTARDTAMVDPEDWMPAIQLEKMALTSEYTYPGDSVGYTIIVENTGNIIISELTVTDTDATEGPAYVSGDTNNDNKLDLTETWLYTAERKMTQEDIDAGFFINTSGASGNSVAGVVPQVQDTALARANQLPSLVLRKEITSSYRYRRAGDVLDYLYTIKNTGNVTLGGPFQVTDDRISGISPLSAVLGPGDSITLTASYVVDIDDLVAGNVTNTAYATTTFDGNVVRSNDDSAVAIVDAADISVVKKVNEVRPDVGEDIIFTLEVSNAGPNTATGISVRDVLPSGYQAIKDITSGGVYDEVMHVVNWDNLSVSVGTTVTLQFTVTVMAVAGVASYDNYAELDSLDQYDPDSTPGNGSEDEDDDDRSFTTPRRADLVTTKLQIDPALLPLPNDVSSWSQIQQVVPSVAVAGDKIYYALHQENLGPDTSFQVLFRDKLPLGIINGEYSIDFGNTWLVWNDSVPLSVFASIAGDVYLLIRGDIDPAIGGIIENTSNIEPSITYDPDLTNNSSTLQTQIEKLADLVITKSDEGMPVDIGDTLTYTLTVLNQGPSVATGVIISDTLDPSVFIQVAYSENGGSTWQSGWSSDYNAGTLGVGEIREIRIRAVVADKSPVANRNPVHNICWVTSEIPDPDVTNNSDTVVTPLREQANLRIVKTGPETICAGDTAYFMVRIYNLGNTFASRDISVTESYDALIFEGVEYSEDGALTWQSWSLLGGAYLLSADLAPRDSFTLWIRAVVKSGVQPGVVSNSISVSSASTPDDEQGNNSDLWLFEVTNCSDLDIVKTLVTPVEQLLAGDPVEFELRYTNHGPSDAYGVVLTDMLPSGLLPPFTFAACGSTTFGPYTGSIAVGQLSKGESCAVRIRAIADDSLSGELTNIGCIMGDGNDPDDSNNKDTLVFTVLRPSISLVKSADLSVDLAVDDVVTYSYTVKNTGNVTLRNIRVNDVHEGSGVLGPILPVSYDSLVAGQEVVFTAAYSITQEDIDSGQSIRNIAQATGSYNMKEYTAKDTLLVFTEARNPSIELVKSGVWIDGNSSMYPDPDEEISYTFDITNTGNVTLRDVVLADTLVSLDCGTFNGVLLPGETKRCSAVYAITQADIDTGSRDNTAIVEASDPENNLVSDTDEATVILPQNTLVAFIKKGSSLRLRTDNLATPGDTITFTYEMTNTGNVTLYNVQVTENDFTGDGNWPQPFFVSGDKGSPEGIIKVGETLLYRAYYPIVQADINTGFVNNRGLVTAVGPQVLLPVGKASANTSDLSDSSNPNDPNETGVPSDPFGDDPTYTFIPHDGRIGVAKSVVGLTKLSNSNFSIRFRIRVGNPGNLILENLLLTDDVENKLGTAFVSYASVPVVTSIVGNPVLPVLGGTPDILYDGTGGKLHPGDNIEIEFDVEIDPDAFGAPDPLLNQAYATGLPTDGMGNVLVNQKKGLPETPYVPGDIEDVSDSGTDVGGTNPGNPGDTGGEDDPTPVIVPSIDVAKSIIQVAMPDSGIPGNRELTFRFRVQNSGNTDLEDIQLTDALRDELRTIWVALRGLPQIAFSNATETPVLSSSYDGDAFAQMFNGVSGYLKPRETVEVVLTAEVNPNADTTYAPVYNQALVSGYGLVSGGVRTFVSDLSDDGYDPQGSNPDYPGDTGGPDDPTPVLVPVVSAVKYVQAYLNPLSGIAGHFDILMRIGLKNVGNVPLANISLMDTIALTKYFGAYFTGLAPGTVPTIITSTATVTPVVNLAFNGRLTQPVILNSSGFLRPGQHVVVEMRLEMDATIVPGPDSLWNRAAVIGYAAKQDGSLYLDSLGNTIFVDDISDAGVNYETTNPDQPEDQDTPDDETLFQFIANLGDRVWDDRNGDGLQTTGEPGIPGVIVKLYGTTGLVATKVTDSQGKYLFSDLLPGTYYVHYHPPTGFIRTFASKPGSALNSDVTNGNGNNTTGWITLSSPGTFDIDAGFYKCIQVGDLVWYDTNKNDVWNTNENGINNITVRIWRNDGQRWTLWNTTKTGSKPGSPSDDGYFTFCVPPGQYYFEVVMPPQGLVRARPNIGNIEEIDSDVTNAFGPGTTNAFTLSAGQNRMDFGAGFYPMATAGNLVWRDDNLNGLQEAEESRVGGVRVEVFDAVTGEKVGESVTDGKGTYKIDYLEKRDVYFKFTPPQGFGPTIPRGGDDQQDSDVDHTNGLYTTRTFSLLPGENYVNIDMGLTVGVLPVEWVNVGVEQADKGHLVSWMTAREINVSHYVVERKMETDKDFVAISPIVYCKGNRSSYSSYSFVDEDVKQPGVYVYRIRQADFDGTESFSRWVKISKSIAKDIRVYPNPAKNNATVEVVLEEEATVSVELVDGSGKLVQVVRSGILQAPGYELYNIDLQTVASGVYNVQVTINGVREFLKLIRIE